jgi:LPS-assembly protein
VTDPYYLRDFGSNANETQANQLLNQIRFSYQDADWDVHLTNQLYQTLHRIDQLSIPTYNQYKRLPELNAHYYHFYQGVDINLNSDATHFAFDSAFPPETGTLPTGFRAHIRPSIGKTLFWKGTYIHPSLAIDQVAYQLDQGSASSYQHARTTPIVQIDSGMYLHEDAHWFGNTYEHIVEPRLFYLYVPYQDQNQLPNFDTQLLPFSYLQLFQINRFIGPDRFQNANQISLGISSRLLSQDDGREKIAFEIGSGYYFTQPRVCTTTPCVIPESHVAPIATHLRLTPTGYPWSIDTNATYEPAKKELDNLSVGLAYHAPNTQQMLRMDYTYLHANANTINTTDTSLDEDTSLYHLRFALPVYKQWHTLAGVYYNQTEHRFENYFGALEYHSCCLSLRLMLNRIFLGQGLSETGTQLRSRYNTQYIIQLKFNGIGSAGNRDISSLLKTELPEYSDPFKY